MFRDKISASIRAANADGRLAVITAANSAGSRRKAAQAGNACAGTRDAAAEVDKYGTR